MLQEAAGCCGWCYSACAAYGMHFDSGAGDGSWGRDSTRTFGYKPMGLCGNLSALHSHGNCLLCDVLLLVGGILLDFLRSVRRSDVSLGSTTLENLVTGT